MRMRDIDEAIRTVGYVPWDETVKIPVSGETAETVEVSALCAHGCHFGSGHVAWRIEENGEPVPHECGEEVEDNGFAVWRRSVYALRRDVDYVRVRYSNPGRKVRITFRLVSEGSP